MEESSQNVYKRLIRTFVYNLYGVEAYIAINYLLEQEYRVSLWELRGIFGDTISKRLDILFSDRIISRSTDDIVKIDVNGSSKASSFGVNERGRKAQNFYYYIDYPKALNVIEYVTHKFIEAYKESMKPKQIVYECKNDKCSNNASYDSMQFSMARNCPMCGEKLVYTASKHYKTNFDEYFKSILAMIEKTKECEKFPVVQPMTRQQRQRLNDSRNATKKNGGDSSSAYNTSDSQVVEVEVLDEDKVKPLEALSLNPGGAPNREKIPWLTKSYHDIILEHVEQENASPTLCPPGSRPPPPDYPLEKKLIKLEKTTNQGKT